MSDLTQAIVTATLSHAGQKRKVTEMPYILHPMRVMLNAARFSNEAAIVAILHDALEDTNLTYDELVLAGFSQNVLDALACMTKSKGMDYFEDYLPRIKHNPLAAVVKILDIEDNMSDLHTLGAFDAQAAELLRYKYEKALAYLRK